MKSYTVSRNLIQSLVNKTDSTTASLLDTFLNDSIRTVCSINGGKWQFLETTEIVDTVASQRAYEIPNTIRKLTADPYVTVGSTTYVIRIVEDENQWRRTLAANRGESDVLDTGYIQAGQILVDPIPSTSGYDITLRGRLNVKDLSNADYTTGTLSLVAGSTALTIGGGGTLTAAMAGRYIRATSGDMLWYKIASFTDGTHAVLTKVYEGATLETSAFTIGEMSPIPEAYDMAPIYRSVALYWDKEGDLNRSGRYWRLYDGGYEAGLSQTVGGLIGQMIQEQGEKAESVYTPPLGDIGIGDPRDDSRSEISSNSFN